MTNHRLAIDTDWDDLRLTLVCTATPGSPCRMRPTDGRETWQVDDPDLVDSGECWAVEWIDAAGWESVFSSPGVKWPTIPVHVACDEGVEVWPATDEPLPIDGSNR